MQKWDAERLRMHVITKAPPLPHASASWVDYVYHVLLVGTSSKRLPYALPAVMRMAVVRILVRCNAWSTNHELMINPNPSSQGPTVP